MPLDDRSERAVELLRRMIASLLAMVRAPGPSVVRARGRVAKRELDRLLLRLIHEKRLEPGTDFLSRMANLEDDHGVFKSRRRFATRSRSS